MVMMVVGDVVLAAVVDNVARVMRELRRYGVAVHGIKETKWFGKDV